MGYYSDIAVGLYKKDFDRLVKKFEDYDEETIELRCLFQDCKTVTIDDTEYTVALGYDVKYYSYFGEVKAFEEFLKDVPYAFVRVGESYDDNVYEVCDETADGESDYNFYKLVCLSREVSVDEIVNRGKTEEVPNTAPLF